MTPAHSPAFYHYPRLRERWTTEIEAGLLGVCGATELEIYFGARSKSDRDRLRRDLREVLRWVIVPDRALERALRVQQKLFDRGCHRSAGAIDLLVAATAEEQGLTVLHYAADFLQVAEVTGQPVRWVADPGTVD